MLGSGGFAKVFLMEEQETKKRQNICGETTNPGKQMAKQQHHSIVKSPTSWIMDEIVENFWKPTYTVLFGWEDEFPTSGRWI